ncbi:hypothetical protein E4T50_06382 [Aureobasidium sp. EXF-12298]|nr:hypothetical protein E4T50_06382 [Aureobasidium sp. EXF-12298]KAI4766306.1 hypothetical protein E4T51_00712 [Aureobasidium sp. EXF-12344]KAI4783780.1 hypothetical protein E4T52_01246 [Aureobasidium sp. EXF-3400]
MPFNEEKVSTWTHQSVKAHVESSRNKLKAFYQNFFGWSAEEFKEAKAHTVAELRKYFDPSKKSPTTGAQAALRYTVQINLVQDWPELFMERHGPSPPAWFDAEFISRPPRDTESFNMKNVVQQFISLCRNLSRNHDAKQLKRKNRADEDDDDDDNYDDDGNTRVLNKQLRSSSLDRTARFPSITPVSVPSCLPVTSTSSRTEGNRQTLKRYSNSRGEVNSPTRATIGQISNIRVKSSLSLVLYITRVTIACQNLNLERDRFALVDNLFENGHLVEPRIHELVFGNPMDNKPTFLWFFDDTSDDEPRSIRNRLSAETATTMLRAWAERLGASGIQIFDAPDYDTAALVPVHEVTRRDKFVQRASFELELEDNGYHDDDKEDDEGAKRGFEADSAYKSRDRDLRRENEAIQETPNSEPNEQQYQQQVKMESESESEEE